MIQLIPASVQNISVIQQLSDIVWPATFSDILSQEQVEYMMDMMYSTSSLTRQMEVDGHRYILAKNNDEYIAYMAYQTSIDKQYTKIHKIYVLPTTQGTGIGKLLIDYALHQAHNAGDSILRLNVNRYNKALEFYKKAGFTIASTEDNDIGNGFLMEDYVMEMSIKGV